ncbi:ATP-binding cassette domain-containing protein [Streptomyces sp. C3-3]|nr:ATP-binding cassette domain-containing protein [Streptomyces sp. C3-3]
MSGEKGSREVRHLVVRLGPVSESCGRCPRGVRRGVGDEAGGGVAGSAGRRPGLPAPDCPYASGSSDGANVTERPRAWTGFVPWPHDAHGTVQLADVVHRYGRGGEDVTVVGPLDLSVTGGEFLVLVGPSGCGKSTLLHLIAGFERPTRGEDLLHQQRVDVDRGGLEQVQREHADLLGFLVRTGQVAVLAVKEVLVRGLPVLHGLEPFVDLLAHLDVRGVVAHERRAPEFFDRLVGGVLGAAAGEGEQVPGISDGRRPNPHGGNRMIGLPVRAPLPDNCPQLSGLGGLVSDRGSTPVPPAMSRVARDFKLGSRQGLVWTEPKRFPWIVVLLPVLVGLPVVWLGISAAVEGQRSHGAWYYGLPLLILGPPWSLRPGTSSSSRLRDGRRRSGWATTSTASSGRSPGRCRRHTPGTRSTASGGAAPK